MDLRQHFEGIAEDTAKVLAPLDKEIDTSVSPGMYPNPNNTGLSVGYLVVLVMRSALLGQYISKISVMYGVRPTDAEFRELIEKMATALKEEYDAQLNQRLAGHDGT